MNQTVYVALGGNYRIDENLWTIHETEVGTIRTFSERKTAQLYAISLVDEHGYDYYEIMEQEVE